MSDSLQRELDEQRERGAAKRPAEVSTTIERALRALRESGIAQRAPGVGDTAPRFALPNVRGATVDLDGLLGRGPVVLAFYRGVW